MARPRRPANPFRYFHFLPEVITTDGLRSYRTAMDELGNGGKQKPHRLNGRANGHRCVYRRRVAFGLTPPSRSFTWRVMITPLPF
jgi:transposase-like protein